MSYEFEFRAIDQDVLKLNERIHCVLRRARLITSALNVVTRDDDKGTFSSPRDALGQLRGFQVRLEPTLKDYERVCIASGMIKVEYDFQRRLAIIEIEATALRKYSDYGRQKQAKNRLQERAFLFEQIQKKKKERAKFTICKIQVMILDKNDSPPEFKNIPPAYFASEDLAPGQAIATMTAEDPDTIGSITYSIQSPENTPFVLDPTSGVLKLKDPLDRETVAEYQIVVRAHDGVQYTEANIVVQRHLSRVMPRGLGGWQPKASCQPLTPVEVLRRFEKFYHLHARLWLSVLGAFGGGAVNTGSSQKIRAF
ncbi:Cadherin-related tumor suppressor [Eumeta japonica]|uniref:Cadherin-related tumor suppressor n=1 Tax=Eumeta variegata TaxID=151549 RepID=A0A4C1WEV8_EUMVA|nr:Cadherin-related tumor suppressor [Eumeta japonica]